MSSVSTPASSKITGRIGASRRQSVSFWFCVRRPVVPTVALVALAVAIDEARFLLLVPVMISALLLVGFSSTLRSGQTPIVERFARLQDDQLPAGAVGYCRSVTKVWYVFFVVNGAVAGALAFIDVTWWAVYTGGIAYALMGLLFGVEYIVRKARFRRFGRGLHDRALARIFPPPANAAPG